MTSFENETDESLMERITSGNHQAFAALVRRHTPLFFSAAYRICAKTDEAEDIVQDAFLKLWDRPEAFHHDKNTKFTTWFYRVVTNLAIDKSRKKKPMAPQEALEALSDQAPLAETAMQEHERAQALEQAIQALPERQKLALNLCFYEGLSNKEAADILGVGLKALESLLVRAKKTLHSELLAKGLIEPPETTRKVAHVR